MQASTIKCHMFPPERKIKVILSFSKLVPLVSMKQAHLTFSKLVPLVSDHEGLGRFTLSAGLEESSEGEQEAE